ncbi:unnamed protein product [Rhizoctonia solani]|uniref:Uncharacterized protein n=1 Tax=Rhizoctonia solani TaxID=456999 RepID=A0A8H3HFI9_9AGAM|nr:unnamed protein product [Rhizoctonia solani]
MASAISMIAHLNKSMYGMPGLLTSEDSSDESDEEYDDPMHRRVLDIGGLHVHLVTASPPNTPPTLNVLLDVPGSEAGLSEDDRVRVNVSVAVNALANLRLTEDGDLQHEPLSTHETIAIPAHHLSPNNTTQATLPTTVESSQNAQTGASTASAGSVSENLVSGSSTQESESASGAPCTQTPSESSLGSTSA